MRITLSLYIIISLLSFAIIGGALLTQYVWGEPFYDFIGRVSIRGSQIDTAGEREGRIRRAAVHYRGFIFNFSTPLMQITASRISARHRIQSYRKEAHRLVLYFDGEIELHFHLPPDEKDELLIQIRDPQQTLRSSGADYISIDYRCPTDVCVAERRIVQVVERGDAHYLYLPPDATLDRSQIRISLRNPVRTLQFSTTYTPQLLEELEGRAVRLLESVAGNVIELRQQFIRQAYENWQEHSYITAEGQWIDREGNASFDEQIMLANLSEALAQDNYTRTFNAMRRAYRQNREQATIRSLPYIGDSFFLVPQFAATERIREEHIGELLDSEAIFEDLQTLQYLHFRAPQQTSAAFSTRIAESDYFNLTTYQLLNMLEYLLFDVERNSVILEEIIVKRIVPRIFINDNRFFLKNKDNNIDFYFTLRTASLLRKFASFAAYSSLLSIADALQYSVLYTADENSYTPRYATVKNDQIATVHGYINPADVYRYLADSAHYDTHIALDREQRLWMIGATAVEVGGVTKQQIRLKVDAPREQAFYVVVGNSDRPRRVEIGGTEYGGGVGFQTRLQGWHWFGDARILVIKFHRRDSNRDIVIQYG